MNEINGHITYNGKEYPLAFTLNVMERIQEEYGSIDRWGQLTDGADGEPNAKAVIFGFTEMINEGIDIENETRDEKEPFLTTRQVGRIITGYGLAQSTQTMQETVINSTQSAEKNASSTRRKAVKK